MTEQILILGDEEELTLPLPGGLSTSDGRSITRMVMGYRLGSPIRTGESVRTSLEARIRYLQEDGQPFASEWLQTDVTFRRSGQSWTCQVGPNWSWSTDWPN